MNFNCLIPARKGSKGIKNKNIVNLLDIPLIAYSIFVAKQSKYIKNVYVSTDSKEIAEISEYFGAQVPFLRPSYLATDTASDREVFVHFMMIAEELGLNETDYIVHLRPTSPGREINIIDEAIEKFLKDDNCTSLRSAHLTKNCPYKWFKIKEDYYHPIFESNSGLEFHNMPRQQFPEVYIPNGYVDIVKQNVFKKEGVFHGNKIKVFKTDEIIDIDQFSDLERAKHDKVIIKLSQIIEKVYGLSFNSL